MKIRFHGAAVAAAMIAFGLSTSGEAAAAASHAAAHGAHARISVPHPRLPKGQSYSASAIAGQLAQRHFKVEAIFQKGAVYSVTATGPSGNRVQLTVDGPSGAIVGLAVLKWTPQARRPAPHAAPPAHFAGDTQPFGAVIPPAVTRHWTSHPLGEFTRRGPTTMTITSTSASTYSPYMEAVPYNYFVPRPNSDAVVVVPPSYEPYVIYDPSGALVDEALDQRDAAERDAELARERAEYERMRAEAAENNNAAISRENQDLRDQLEVIQSEPPADYVPPTPTDNEDYLEPMTSAGPADEGPTASQEQTVEPADNSGGGQNDANDNNDNSNSGGQNDASDNNDGGGQNDANDNNDAGGQNDTNDNSDQNGGDQNGDDQNGDDQNGDDQNQ